MTKRQLNIKNKTYYFCNDLINVSNLEASNLKLDKKNSLGLDIYYIGYIDKKPEWNGNSVNPLHLIINRVYGSIPEKNGNKFLTIERGDSVVKKYDQVFSGIKHHIKKIEFGNKFTDNVEVNYNTDYNKTKFLSYDSLPLNKLIYFPTLNCCN